MIGGFRMGSVIDGAVETLRERLADGFDGCARIAIEGEGSIVVDDEGVRAGSEDDGADVTLSADAETFRSILEGDLDPSSAFMSGRLTVDGDMGVAMRFGARLADA